MKSTTSEKLSYRFPIWLTVIFLLLFLVPLFILTNNIFFAKISGFFSLVVVLIAIRFWLRITRFNSNRSDRVPLNKNVIFDLERKYHFLYSIDSGDKKILFHRTGLILAEARFIAADQFIDLTFAADIALNIALYLKDNVYINLNGLIVQTDPDATNQMNILKLIPVIDFPLIDKNTSLFSYYNDLLDSSFGLKLKDWLLNNNLNL